MGSKKRKKEYTNPYKSTAEQTAAQEKQNREKKAFKRSAVTAGLIVGVSLIFIIVYTIRYLH